MTNSGPGSGASLGPAFPAGLRVMVVDDDSLCLKVTEQMLRTCQYTVSSFTSSTKALNLLRERKKDFDLVLSDVFMPDMDGFKLLETIGLELDLPVIMMSSSGDTNVVLRGITHGAVDFLIKPVRVEELRNVWQHVFRRKRDLVKDLDGQETKSEAGRKDSDCPRKRKDIKDKKAEDGYATKKPRVTWSKEMHEQFLNAVHQLGVEKAVPKKILELMSVKGLTRENVASHLQKYRHSLKRMAGIHSQKGAKAKTVNASEVPNAMPVASTSVLPLPSASACLMGTPPLGNLAPGMVGAMSPLMGGLVPPLNTLGSTPNLANMQMQLQQMQLQNMPMGLNLGVNPLMQPGAGMLGMGLGGLQTPNPLAMFNALRPQQMPRDQTQQLPQAGALGQTDASALLNTVQQNAQADQVNLNFQRTDSTGIAVQQAVVSQPNLFACGYQDPMFNMLQMGTTINPMMAAMNPQFSQPMDTQVKQEADPQQELTGCVMDGVVPDASAVVKLGDPELSPACPPVSTSQDAFPDVGFPGNGDFCLLNLPDPNSLHLDEGKDGPGVDILDAFLKEAGAVKWVGAVTNVVHPGTVKYIWKFCYI